jgi:hypothetical protein
LKSRNLSLLGLTLVTPAIGAGQAMATPTARMVAQTSDPAALTRMKAELLSIDPEAKLGIAGDRVQLIQLSANGSKIIATSNCRRPAGVTASYGAHKCAPVGTMICMRPLVHRRTHAAIASGPACHALAAHNLTQSPP